MNIIVSSSRGRAVEPYFRKAYTHHSPYKFVTIPGGKIESLTEIAIELISKLSPDTKPVHIYYLAGIPDITTILADRRNHYEEVVFNGEPQSAINHMSSLIILTHELISSHNAKAIFAP